MATGRASRFLEALAASAAGGLGGEGSMEMLTPDTVADRAAASCLQVGEGRSAAVLAPAALS